MSILHPIKIYDIPFVPSSDERIKIMMELAAIQLGSTTADLGSGNGRVVIEMAKQGAIAHGYEIDTDRVRISRNAIQKLNLDNTAFIHHQSFWDVSLSPYDVITIYGITSIMNRLESKLWTETKSKCVIVSNAFTLPTWPLFMEKGGVYAYIKP